MWSVWSDTADVYLGQNLSMIKARGKQAVLLPHPATLPLDRVLSKLAELAAKDLGKGVRLRISLSGALCPAIGFAVPKGLRSWKELHEIAHANAAACLGSDATSVTCELDPTRPGVTAAMSQPMKDEIDSWARQHGWRMTSLQPLWAQTTRMGAVSSRGILAMLLQEPDSITLVAENAQGTIDAVTLTGLPDSPELQSGARRWLSSHEVTEEKVFRIGFAASQRAVIPTAPRTWAAHWSQL